jgi:hypothetical protein
LCDVDVDRRLPLLAEVGRLGIDVTGRLRGTEPSSIRESHTLPTKVLRAVDDE